jgi:hypothetical protein
MFQNRRVALSSNSNFRESTSVRPVMVEGEKLVFAFQVLVD